MQPNTGWPGPARAAGIPAPEYQLTGDGWIVQELLPGRLPSEVDDALLAELVALNERFAGLGAGLDPAPLPLYLTESGPGFCVHESLDRYDGASGLPPGQRPGRRRPGDRGRRLGRRGPR